MIPKKSAPEDPGDFRPITITSILLRLFNKIIAKRLTTRAPLRVTQKGFAMEEGVAANLFLIQKNFKQAQTRFDNLFVAFIEFRKAFDSVGHPSLVAATKRWGFPPSLTEYVTNLYKKASTDIMGEQVNITRGVLQGDPLSPYLFNISLDWVLAGLPKGVGITMSDFKVNHIAYADDVALVNSTAAGLQKSLDKLHSLSSSIGLKIGHAKCATISILGDKKRKRWLVDQNSNFHVDNIRLKALQYPLPPV